LSTDGRFIVDANGRRVRLAGVNWIAPTWTTASWRGWIACNRGALAETIAKPGLQLRPFPVQRLDDTADVTRSRPLSHREP